MVAVETGAAEVVKLRDLALQGGAFSLWYNLIRFVTPIAVAIVFVYNLTA